MRVEKEIWQERMNNLMERRKISTGGGRAYNIIGDYRRHLSMIRIGQSVLDVGCGSMAIKEFLSPSVEYTGIDAFPVNDHVVKMEIEECSFPDNSFDTIICFAVLDGLYDAKKAIDHMKRICRKNILFLTGINIPVDKFHTFKITESFLNSAMDGFSVGHKEYFGEKVLLIEYLK